MRAKEIMNEGMKLRYRESYSTYEQHLKKVIELRKKQNRGFEMRVYNARLNRWLTAKNSETVVRQVMATLQAGFRKQEKETGRMRLTLRDINKLRKVRDALTAEEYERLKRVEDMYGGNNT